MDDASLRTHLEKFYSFGSEFVRLGGCDADLDAVLDGVGPGGFVFSVGLKHIKALRSRGVDGRDLYAFSALIVDALEGGEVPLWELRRARRLAFLELQLFDESFAEVGDELPPSQKAVMSTLREVGERMTTTRLLEAMGRAGHDFADSTVKNALSILVTTRRIDNRQDTSPRGYGLPEWPTV